MTHIADSVFENHKNVLNLEYISIILILNIEIQIFADLYFKYLIIY